MKPNPNLWAVDIVDKKNGAIHLALWVCAPNVSSAEHKGTIDVF